MGLTVKVTPQIPSEATLHASLSVEDVAVDDRRWNCASPWSTIRQPVRAPQVFTVNPDGTTMTAPSGQTVAWLVGEEPAATVADRMGKTLLAAQDLLEALKDAGAILVTPAR